jgi:hypothetical protein
MNPFLRSTFAFWKYIFISIGIALTYAFSIGFVFSFSVICILSDAFLFGFLFSLEGLLMWNILRYGILESQHPLMKIILQIVLGILMIGSILGIETIVLYLLFNPCFDLYIQSLMIRIFISILLYLLFLLYYKSNLEGKEPVNPNENIILEEKEPKELLERITVRNGQKIKIIPLNEIIYLQAEGDYVAIITAEGRWLKEQTMKYFEENLPGNLFIRIHRSYIVALSAISRIERAEQQHNLILFNKERIKISITGYRILKEKLKL